MLLVTRVALVTLAALNAILTARATVLDTRHASALMRALGANSRQVSSGLAAQVLSALPGAILGVPLGVGLLKIAAGSRPAVPASTLAGRHAAGHPAHGGSAHHRHGRHRRPPGAMPGWLPVAEGRRYPMRVLVTCGSTRGGTEGLAHLVADDLRDEGVTVDLLPPSQVKNLDDYDAVVVGGALYSSRWHRQARQFVRQHTAELRQRPTFFFSSGPLDNGLRGQRHGQEELRRLARFRSGAGLGQVHRRAASP